MKIIKTNEAIRFIENIYRVENPDTPFKVDNFITKEIPSILDTISYTDKDCITLNDLYNIRDEIFSAECGQTYLRIDGEEYSSDMGYAFDGINIFFDVLEKRLLKF